MRLKRIFYVLNALVFSKYQRYLSIVKVVIAYGKCIFSSPWNPRGCSQSRLQEEERTTGNIIALKADFSRQNGIVARCIVYRTIKHRAELYTVFTIENHTVNSVWIVCRSYSVKYNISDRDLTEE